MRLTEKDSVNCYWNIDDTVNGAFFVTQKLGPLEDTEKELDIDLRLLPKLFKLKEKDIVFVKENTGIKEATVTGNVLQNGELIVFTYYVFDGIYITPVLPYRTYGKEWALTRKELEHTINDKI